MKRQTRSSLIRVRLTPKGHIYFQNLVAYSKNQAP